MLKSLMEKREALMARFAKVEESQIQDAELRSKFRSLKAKQGGFTLLELLVVVAILAAIAGTAAIALQDTDARASAAAHVAMMDELNKGVRTFRVLNKNTLPNNYDSLLVAATSDTAGVTAATASSVLAIEDIDTIALTADIVGILDAGGVTQLQYLGEDQGDDAVHGFVTASGDGCTDANMQATIASRSNHVVAGNIFLTPDGNGCGFARTLAAGDQAAFWTGGEERLLGQPVAAGIVEYDGTNLATATSKAFLAVGLGPASNLFNANDLGGMTSVPVYRHVSETEYNRFVALFNVGDFDGAGSINAGDQVVLSAIVDGAGDTKEEELGEWDGTRNTI